MSAPNNPHVAVCSPQSPPPPPPCGLGLVSSFWTRMKGILGFCLYCCFYSYEHLKAVCVWICGCMDVFELHFSWTYCKEWSRAHSMCLVGVHSVCADCVLIARVCICLWVFEARWHAPQHTSQPSACPPSALGARPILTDEVWVYVCVLPSKHESCLPSSGFILFSSLLLSSPLLILDFMHWAMS